MTLPLHLRALIRLKKAKVDFLMVGAMALDHYAPETASVYLTADCDILLRPTSANLTRAFRTLRRAGYHLLVNGEPLVRPDPPIVRRLLEHRITVRAQTAGGMPLDLLLEAKGFRFEEWWKGRTHFKAGRALISCGALEHVLESKRQSGRSKDRALLRLFKKAVSDRP